MKTPYIAAAALIAGLLGGGAIGAVSATSDPKDSDEYKHAQDVIAQKNEGLEEGIATLEQVQTDLMTIEGDLPERESALANAEAELDQRAKKLEKARLATLRLLDDVEKRERAVGLVEREIARNTIPGDGVWRVGKDMKPGTYRTDGGAGRSCYWSINADANGANIINNGIGAGPAIVSVLDGQFFETSGCRDWLLQN